MNQQQKLQLISQVTDISGVDIKKRSAWERLKRRQNNNSLGVKTFFTCRDDRGPENVAVCFSVPVALVTAGNPKIAVSWSLGVISLFGLSVD